MSWQEVLKQKPLTGPPSAKYRDMLMGIQKLPFRLDTFKEMNEEEMGKMFESTAEKIITWVKNATLDNLNVNVDRLRTENGDDISTTTFDDMTERMHSSQFTNIDGYSVKLTDLVRDQQKRSRTRGYRSVVSPQLIFTFEIVKDGKEIFYLSVKKNSWDAHSNNIDWRKRLNV